MNGKIETLAEYNKRMEESGANKVWIVESAPQSETFITSRIFATEEEAKKFFNNHSEKCFLQIYQTWDIWGWMERKNRIDARGGNQNDGAGKEDTV